MTNNQNINPTFAEVVGQEKVKTTLSLYLEAYSNTGRIPFLNLTTQAGGGKSYMARLFRSGLKRPDGSTPPLLEINAASIKTAGQFFEQVYPVWTQNNAVLFLDEIHAAPKDLQDIFLSILDVKKSPVRSVQWEDSHYDFDFNKISFISATTNQEKLTVPLRDRLKDISFQPYKQRELLEIFENQLFPDIEFSMEAKQSIIMCFRGNPRDAVVKADDIRMYCSAKGLKKVELHHWKDFCHVMSVNPHGLTNSEMTIVRVLGQRTEMTLNGLASATGFSRNAIQRDYESMLVRKNLMEINQKRRLSADGIRFYNQHAR
jgi:Holliday junction resolvasome RuvABC ATP-dependent DNA helicase subunit